MASSRVSTGVGRSRHVFLDSPCDDGGLASYSMPQQSLNLTEILLSTKNLAFNPTAMRRYDAGSSWTLCRAQQCRLHASPLASCSLPFEPCDSHDASVMMSFLAKRLVSITRLGRKQALSWHAISASRDSSRLEWRWGRESLYTMPIQHRCNLRASTHR